MTVIVHAENTTLAGQRCWKDIEDLTLLDDVAIYEGTPEELRQVANHLRKTDGALGRANAYRDRVAATIESALSYES